MCDITPFQAAKIGLPITVLAFSSLGLAIQQPSQREYALVKEFNVNQDSGGRYFAPSWIEGTLIYARHNQSDTPVIVRVDESGLAEDIPITIPQARYLSVTGASNGSDGRIAVVGGGYDEDSKPATFLVLISSDYKNQVVTRLTPFVPNVVAIAPDGIAWVIGWVRDSSGNASESNVLRRFDRSGRLLSTQSLNAKPANTGTTIRRPNDTTELSVLRANLDRLGWLSNTNQYIEFSVQGEELLRLVGPPVGKDRPSSAFWALSADNEVVVYRSESGTNRGYWRLNRADLTWTSIPFDPPSQVDFPVPVGFDRHGRLVMLTNSSVLRFYHRQ